MQQLLSAHEKNLCSRSGTFKCSPLQKKRSSREFPGGPVAKDSALPMQGARIRELDLAG